MAADEDTYRTLAFSRAHCDDLADAATVLKQFARGGKLFYSPTEIRRLAATLGVLEDRWETAGASEQVFADPGVPVPYDRDRPVPPNQCEHGYTRAHGCPDCHGLPYNEVEREHVEANVSLLRGWQA